MRLFENTPPNIYPACVATKPREGTPKKGEKGKEALPVKGSKTTGTSGTATAPAAAGRRGGNASLETEKHDMSSQPKDWGEGKNVFRKRENNTSYRYISSERGADAFERR